MPVVIGKDISNLFVNNTQLDALYVDGVQVFSRAGTDIRLVHEVGKLHYAHNLFEGPPSGTFIGQADELKSSYVEGWNGTVLAVTGAANADSLNVDMSSISEEQALNEFGPGVLFRFIEFEKDGNVWKDTDASVVFTGGASSPTDQIYAMKSTAAGSVVGFSNPDVCIRKNAEYNVWFDVMSSPITQDLSILGTRVPASSLTAGKRVLVKVVALIDEALIRIADNSLEMDMIIGNLVIKPSLSKGTVFHNGIPVTHNGVEVQYN